MGVWKMGPPEGVTIILSLFLLSGTAWACISKRTDELLLSAPQPTFKHGGWTFSNCSLLHKLLITGQAEQVVSRRGELDQDLLSTTCEFGNMSKVTPLHLASWFMSSVTVANTLVQAGANVDALDSVEGGAQQRSSLNCLRAGGNVDALDGDQQSQEFKAVTK